MLFTNGVGVITLLLDNMDNHGPVRLDLSYLCVFHLNFKPDVLQGSIVGIQLYEDCVFQVLEWVTSTLDYMYVSLYNHDSVSLDPK